jgi:ribosomal protein S18 acetylase RimI-like enzyme
MKIRKATPKDFQKLKEIKTEFFLWECKMDDRVNPDYAKRNLGVRLGINLRQKNVVFFIAEDNGKIVAYAGAQIEKNYPPNVEKFRGHLFNLYVRKEYQSKGIGTKLIKKVLAWFKEKKITDLKIMVYSKNEGAHKLYERMGYKDYIVMLRKCGK